MNPNIEKCSCQSPSPGRGIDENRQEKTGKAYRILAVDDEPMVLRVLSRILSRAGYTVQTAGNGREALELFKANGFDLVISDFHMPVMNGLELLGEIKSINPAFRVITHAGGLNQEEKSKLKNRGVFEIIEKPADSQQILSVVECALACPFEGEEPLADDIIGTVKAMVRVLFVDDDADTRDSMADVACYMGFQMQIASCGKDALAMYAKDRPDVVISDFHMPEMNGLELLKALRAADPKARVIIVSGEASGAERKALIEAGAFMVLQKPVEMAVLAGAVNGALAEE